MSFDAQQMLPADVLAALRQSMKRGDKLTLGKIQFLGLDRLRERFGERWNEKAEIVFDMTERAFRRRLCPQDVIWRVGRAGLLVIFSQLDDETAQLKCAAIIAEIEAKLIGETECGDMVSLSAQIANGSPADAAWDFLRQSGLTGEARPADSEPATPVLKEQPALVLRPMLNPQSRAVTGLMPTMIMRYPDGDRADWRAPLGYGVSEEEHTARALAIDEAMLNELPARLSGLNPRRQKFRLWLPLHFSPMKDWSRRAQILDRVGSIPNVNPRLMTLEIRDVPLGAPIIRVQEAVAAARARFPVVAVCLDPGFADLNGLAQSGVRLIGIDNAAWDASERAKFQLLNSLVPRANKLGLGFFLHGADSRSLAAAAIGAGADMVDGAAVSADHEVVVAAHRYELTQLFD